jgi:mediator of RNA polymerase II transcription subunit 13
MFPTPPSHEPNPISSPGGLQADQSTLENFSNDPSSSVMCIRRPQENYPGLGSPPDEPHHEIRLETTNSLYHMRGAAQQQLRMHLQDWSFVFKPPTTYKVLGSSKYAPLPSLPSQQLPPLPLPPNISSYKATWQFTPGDGQQQQQQQQPNQSVQPQQTSQRNPPIHPHPPHQPQHQQMCVAPPNIPNQMHLRPGLSPISPVPTSIRSKGLL